MGLIFAGVHADITHRALTHARLGVSANHAPGRRDLTLYCGRRGRDVSTGTNANRKNRRFRPASEAGPIRAETTPRAHGGVRPPPIVSESQRLEMGAERVIEEKQAAKSLRTNARRSTREPPSFAADAIAADNARARPRRWRFATPRARRMRNDSVRFGCLPTMRQPCCDHVRH
jgi:hypothetical protein